MSMVELFKSARRGTRSEMAVRGLSAEDIDRPSRAGENHRSPGRARRKTLRTLHRQGYVQLPGADDEGESEE